ncbi:hypothetical protein [Thermococcus sp.]|uniref:hypothetical protein n=1 Tax=Thermococcus sp. TaxID=35749 RepID=UPI002638DC24|nr:hypothetical protein [Thermococcus sp.]
MNRAMTPFLFSLIVYLSIIAAVRLLPPSDEGPSPVEEFLQIGLIIMVPALASFLFLRKVKVDPGAFWVASTITTVLASSIIYALFTMNCTPTTCDDGVVWFFVTALVLLGFLIGALLYKLTERPGSRSSPT